MISADTKANKTTSNKRSNDCILQIFVRTTFTTWKRCKRFWLVFYPSWYCPLGTGAGVGLQAKYIKRPYIYDIYEKSPIFESPPPFSVCPNGPNWERLSRPWTSKLRLPTITLGILPSYQLYLVNVCITYLARATHNSLQIKHNIN